MIGSVAFAIATMLTCDQSMGFKIAVDSLIHLEVTGDSRTIA
jgi:uncharacterized membrane protein